MCDNFDEKSSICKVLNSYVGPMKHRASCLKLRRFVEKGTKAKEEEVKKPEIPSVEEFKKQVGGELKNASEFFCKCGANKGWITDGERTKPCLTCGRVYEGRYNSDKLTIDAVEVDKVWPPDNFYGNAAKIDGALEKDDKPDLGPSVKKESFWGKLKNFVNFGHKMCLL